MEWQISFLEAEQVVLVETQGRLEVGPSLAMARAGLEAAQQRGWTRGLIDHRQISASAMVTVDFYDRPEQLRGLGLGAALRIAEVVPQAQADDFKFFETVCANRGIKLAVFFDREAALRWLVEA